MEEEDRPQPPPPRPPLPKAGTTKRQRDTAKREMIEQFYVRNLSKGKRYTADHFHQTHGYKLASVFMTLTRFHARLKQMERPSESPGPVVHEITDKGKWTTAAEAAAGAKVAAASASAKRAPAGLRDIDKQVVEQRQVLLEQGVPVSYSKLARIFNICPSTVKRILDRHDHGVEPSLRKKDLEANMMNFVRDCVKSKRRMSIKETMVEFSVPRKLVVEVFAKHGIDIASTEARLRKKSLKNALEEEQVQNEDLYVVRSIDPSAVRTLHFGDDP